MADEPEVQHTSRGGRPTPQRLTDLLSGLDLTDPVHAAELLDLVYDELRALAAKKMHREKDAITLQPTALVHEAYLRLAAGRPVAWEGREHFFRVAARAMRQVLVDQARRRRAGKRGGEQVRVTLESEMLGESADPCDVLSIHEALERLRVVDPDLERLIELRFFSGLTVEEAADVLGVSPRKAAKDWAAARLWLHRELLGS